MADSDTPKRSNGSSHTSKSLSSFMKNICTVFALGDVLRGHLKKTGNDEHSRALEDLSVVMLLAGNFLLNFTGSTGYCTVGTYSQQACWFFSGVGAL